VAEIPGSCTQRIGEKKMSDLKPCPWCKKDVSIISVEDSTYYWCITCEDCDFSWFVLGTRKEVIEKWNTRPAEDAKDKEIEKLKNDLGIQKNLTRQACFKSNRAYQEVEKWKKMFYDLFDKQSNVATDPKVIIVATDTNVPTNAPDTGKMEEN
jgi:hypothetical protein